MRILVVPIIHSVKKVPGIDHSKSPLKEIIKNLFDDKLAPLSSILTWSLRKENSWILHHDNAPSHKAIIVNKFLAKNSTNINEQPPYSPVMAPADFFLFPKLKLPLRDTRFQSVENIKENSRRELKSIPENAFKKCFDDWIIRWHKCIISKGPTLKAIK